VAGLEQQLRLQNEASERLRALRREHGALELASNEARAQRADGKVVGLVVPPRGRARELIEDFMIAANTALAGFLKAKGRSGIARVVRTPARWPRLVELAEGLDDRLPAEPDPRALADFLARQRQRTPDRFQDLSLAVVKLLGRGEYVLQRASGPPERHFGLAISGYSHSTAPNRRFADLVTQRLIRAALTDAPPPYSDDALSAAAGRCSEMEHAADKVERFMRKVLAAYLLRDRVGEVFQGVVTGASEKGTFARLLNPPAEGRVVQGERGLDVGDAVKVRLLSVDPERGFIDLGRAKG
jgi:exoribonuclease-2